MTSRTPPLFSNRIFRCAFIAVIAGILITDGLARPDQSEQPNVVLIISDDQAWTDYGFMGHDAIQTPHLDQLAKESVLFRRGYVPTALCRPSLMTLATGLYAHQHGVTGNDPSRARNDRNSPEYNELRAELISFIENHDTLPSLLGERGYLSHQSGKWWEGSFQHGGFTHGMTRGFPHPNGRAGDEGQTIGREGMEPIFDFIDHSVANEKPFFVWYAPKLPHTPHDPPARLFDKYKDKVDSPHVARYYAMCEWFDETCGQLVNFLEDKKLRDNTLIVYVCDNGWIQNPEAKGYAPRSKQTPYEAGIRQPIFFNWPAKLKPADRDELVSSIDIFPTVLRATGARMPKGLPGLDLWSNLQNGNKIKRKVIFGEGFAHDIANLHNPQETLLYRWTIEGRWKLLLTYDGEVAYHKTTHPRDEKRPQLFDLLKDPGETKNVAGNHPDFVKRLVKQIDNWYPVTERDVVKVFE